MEGEIAGFFLYVLQHLFAVYHLFYLLEEEMLYCFFCPFI
jgi:hypothetical protein